MRTPATADQLTAPGRTRGLVDIFTRSHLLSLIVRKEIQIRYRGSLFGWLWSYVKPLVQFVVFYVALGVFLSMNRAIDYYAIYILAGITIVTFFNEAISNSTRSLVDNAALIKKIYLPREMFPVSSMLVALVNTLPQVVVVVAIAIFFGWAPSFLQIAALLLAVIIVAVLAVGLGLLFGAINVVFRDAQSFVEIIVMCAIWASPVMYRWEMVAAAAPDWLYTVYRLNPVTMAVELFHYGIWEPLDPRSSPPIDDLWSFSGYALATSVILLIVGQFVFRRLEGRFAQDL
ncbi:sugar ABC transporter permease [Microbacterium aurum]|uniref:Transport permease protein n=1 Tax=Microbacterium aurum TaxID=36805 RepID=A0A1P8UAA3_9MICO|nr:ABC transporter permease [Microbacterium aurum]APZ35048.1 sugar ABC transporter permease [Microbacterium aurum]